MISIASSSIIKWPYLIKKASATFKIIISGLNFSITDFTPSYIIVSPAKYIVGSLSASKIRPLAGPHGVREPCKASTLVSFIFPKELPFSCNILISLNPKFFIKSASALF